MATSARAKKPQPLEHRLLLTATFCLLAGGAVMVYSFVVAGIIAFAIKKTIGIRISPDEEEAGIDSTFHREASY